MLLPSLFARLLQETRSLAANILFDFALRIFPLEMETQTLDFRLVETWQILRASSHHRLCIKEARLFRELITISRHNFKNNAYSVVQATTNLQHPGHLVKHDSVSQGSYGFCSKSRTLHHPAFVGCDSHKWTDPATRNRGNGLMHGGVYPMSGRWSRRPVWDGIQPLNHVTIDIAMFRIYQNPVETTACYGPGLITSWQHLPSSKGQARACSESLLKSVGRLHI